MNDNALNRKIILEGKFEDVIQISDHYYLVSKKNKIAIFPYTISSQGLLDKVGVVYDHNYVQDKDFFTLINGYINSDDNTDLVCANRLLFEILGVNMGSAVKWLYLGNLFNNLTSDSPIKIYAVDITGIQIKEDENVEEMKERKKFKLLDSSKVLQTDDSLLLSSYLRVFQSFYISSLNKQ